MRRLEGWKGRSHLRPAQGQSWREMSPVVVAVWLLVLVIGCGSDAPTVAPVDSVEPTEVPATVQLPLESPVALTATPSDSGEPTEVPATVQLTQESPVAPTATPAISVEPTEVPATVQLTQESPVAPTVTPAGSVESVEVPDTDALSQESAAQSASVSIIFGRAIMSPNGRVTLFYVTNDTSDEANGAVVIDSASITSSDGRTWQADGYGELRKWASLTLGWLTFSVPDGAGGQLRVTVNSAQSGAGPLTGPWRGVEQLDGLIARDDISASIIVESGLCVTAGDGAIGFHRMACGSEFVDPHPIRRAAREATAVQDGTVVESPNYHKGLDGPPGYAEKVAELERLNGEDVLDPGPPVNAGTASENTPVTPSPRPTPAEPSTPPTRSPVNLDEQPYLGEPSLFFVLCTPWHIPLNVKIDNVDAPELYSSPPSTSTRCVLP